MVILFTGGILWNVEDGHQITVARKSLRPCLTIAGHFLTIFSVCRVVPIAEFFGNHLANSLLVEKRPAFLRENPGCFVMQKRPGIFRDVFRPLGVFTDFLLCKVPCLASIPLFGRAHAQRCCTPVCFSVLLLVPRSPYSNSCGYV